MSAFKEHFVDKYFGYRRRYVDYILEAAPHRAVLAVLSEVVRLAFIVAASALCAAIFWLLSAGALVRSAGPGAWFVVSVLCALSASALGLFALGGLLSALRDRRRVAERARRPRL
jgi:CHASE2 domain-containing sensor protein